MSRLLRLSARDTEHSTTGLDRSIVALLIVLVVLLVCTVSLGGALLFLRRRRRLRREQELPYYTEKRVSMSSTASTHRRTTRPSEPAHVSYEKEALMLESSDLPDNTLPEIRITMPEEYDASGKRQSGRVMIVRLGEHGEGLEPVEDGMLVYQEKSGERFHSLDLDRIGGLIEKARNNPVKL